MIMVEEYVLKVKRLYPKSELGNKLNLLKQDISMFGLIVESLDKEIEELRLQTQSRVIKVFPQLKIDLLKIKHQNASGN